MRCSRVQCKGKLNFRCGGCAWRVHGALQDGLVRDSAQLLGQDSLAGRVRAERLAAWLAAQDAQAAQRGGRGGACAAQREPRRQPSSAEEPIQLRPAAGPIRPWVSHTGTCDGRGRQGISAEAAVGSVLRQQ